MIKVLILIISGYLLLVCLAFIFQYKLVFFPDSRLAGTPESVGLDFEDVFLETSDGLRIHGWFVPGPKGKNRASVIFFHGNAGNISHRLETVEIIHRLGLSCLIIDYRGYGRSQGSPSELGLYKDAEAAWKWLVEEKRVEPTEIIPWGRSLGGPVAARLGRDRNTGALIIESTFTSLPELGQRFYPFLPLKLISRLRFPTRKYVQDLSCPVLVVHSTEDDLVPFAFGQKLFESAPMPKRLLKIEGGHNEGFLVSGKRYEQGVGDFLRDFELMGN